MITQTILVNDILEIQYFKLLSKFQHYVLENVENGVFVNRNETNQNIFLKKTNSKRAGKQGLIECYDYILNNNFTENERYDLEKNLKRFNIVGNKLVYDVSIKNLEIIGCKYSKKCFSYYNGCGYCLKIEKHAPHYYNNPKITYKKLPNLDDIVNNLSSDCRNYFNSCLKGIKFNEDLMEEKLIQLRDFLSFLNVNQKEIAFLLGSILIEDNEDKMKTMFIVD